MAIYLPEAESLPPWAGIMVAVVVVPLLAYRAYRLWRAWRRRR